MVYNCNKSECFQDDCPNKGNNKIKSKHKKIIIVAWENNDDESTSKKENEVTNFYLIAHDDNKASDNKSDDEVISPDELHYTFDKLYIKFLKISKELKHVRNPPKPILRIQIHVFGQSGLTANLAKLLPCTRV